MRCENDVIPYAVTIARVTFLAPHRRFVSHAPRGGMLAENRFSSSSFRISNIISTGGVR
jgi:hypothetical protein